MQKKILLPCYILLYITCCIATRSAAQQPLLQNIFNRVYTNLDGKWNYIIDPYENGYYNYRHEPYDQTPAATGGFYDDKKQTSNNDLVEYDFDLSPSMQVPGDWNSQDEKLLFYEGTVWLRRKFTAVPKQGKKYFLYFGAVNYEAHVYLNGKKLGIHKGGFTPFQFDVTGKLNNGENVVVVKADNTRHADEIPTVNTDWWNYGGITRDVLLAEVPEVHIADYKIQLAKNDSSRIEGFVQLSAPVVQPLTINISGTGMQKTIFTDSSGYARIDIPVKNIKYWSPVSPVLYTVQVTGATDTITDKIGFRTIATSGQDILLNGKPVFLRGISLHDEDPLIPGRLRNEKDMRMLLQWSKELGCNYVRLAHYPHNEKMLRLADEMGLLVWAEVPVYWTISWKNAGTYSNAEKQLSDMVTRDKNRCSVIVWSVGNETPVSDERNTFMNNLAAKARALDDTRLVAAALEVQHNSNEMTVADPLGEKLDLASFNEYAGWYFSSVKDMLNLKFTIKFNKPVVITEFGADALGGYHAAADTRFSEEYQEQLYKNQLAMLTAIPALRGMTPWILADFRSPRRPHPFFQNYWNRKGLISDKGKKKKAFFVLQQFYETMRKKYP